MKCGTYFTTVFKNFNFISIILKELSVCPIWCWIWYYRGAYSIPWNRSAESNWDLISSAKFLRNLVVGSVLDNCLRVIEKVA